MSLCNEALLVTYRSAATDQRSRETMNDDAETRKPATVSFATALGENTGGVVFGEYDVQAKR